MLSAIQEKACCKDEVDKAYHLVTFEFLQACNKLFEEGILSHGVINSPKTQTLQNMTAGFTFFEVWHHEISSNNSGEL